MNKKWTTFVIAAIIIAYLATIYFRVVDFYYLPPITFTCACICGALAMLCEFNSKTTTQTTPPPDPTDKGHWWDDVHVGD